MTTRLPLMVGQLNDGIEPEYPDSQVPDVMRHAHVGLFDELDRTLTTQLPDHLCYQAGALGVTIAPDLMTVQNVSGATVARRPVLTVRADYQGCPLSLVTTKRPGRAHAADWPAFDDGLDSLLRVERLAGRHVIIGLDANQAAYTLPGMTWNSPHATSVVGVLTSRGVQVLACTQLPATGEHGPVLTWLRVPALAA